MLLPRALWNTGLLALSLDVPVIAAARLPGNRTGRTDILF